MIDEAPFMRAALDRYYRQFAGFCVEYLRDIDLELLLCEMSNGTMRTTKPTSRGGNMGIGVWTALVLLVLALLGPASSQDADTRYLAHRDTLRGIAFVPAKQRCENWAFAAVLQSVLEMQGVAFSQARWVIKLNGNEICSSFLKTPADLASVIEGDYRLDNADSVHLQVLAENTFLDPGRLIASIRENRPFMLIWKNHAFMAVSLYYIEAIEPSGIRKYDIQEISLMDPFAGAEQQPVVFRKGVASLKEVGGIVEVIATR